MKFKGIIPALVTPILEDERINVPVLKKLINYLLNEGADGFYIAGATGEGLNLRLSERMLLAEQAIETVEHKKPCIIQVAATDFNSAINLARHAEKIGADAISATAPLFFKYDESDIYNYYKALADAVHIPVMVYYNPNAGFAFNAELAARIFEIDNVTAIKWTSSDYFGMMKLKNLTHGEINIINGPDEMLLMGLNAGADAGIGTTYNFMLPIIRGIYDNFINGNIAAAQVCQNRAVDIISALLKYVTIPATKVILSEMGYNVGEATFPMKRYSEAEKRQIITDMRKAGLEI